VPQEGVRVLGQELLQKNQGDKGLSKSGAGEGCVASREEPHCALSFFPENPLPPCSLLFQRQPGIFKSLLRWARASNAPRKKVSVSPPHEAFVRMTRIPAPRLTSWAGSRPAPRPSGPAEFPLEESPTFFLLADWEESPLGGWRRPVALKARLLVLRRSSL